eukprot:TRINITY_DN60291_c0_g1_i1.p1 TRINITY_DN60291_c0_g1~~TRINITY_DN60291_c0_g1_i1.p1  ORF type:complete len:295 (+),score=53.30 TRINITY_DN60291_c0_g1_i1:61-945(+)
MDSALKFLSDPAIIRGVTVTVITVAAVGAGVNSTLDQATGENRQPGDKLNLFFNSSSDGSKIASESSNSNLHGCGDKAEETSSNKWSALFSEYDDYKEELSRHCIRSIHANNPECGIKPNTWNTIIHMDIFQAFGAPGHRGVHGGLMIAYHGLREWFINLSVDLFRKEVLQDDTTIENESGRTVLEKCALEQCLRVVNGIDDNTWEYKGSVLMSILDLFSIVAEEMMKGARRGNYDWRDNNCVHFKNGILAAIGGKPNFTGIGQRKIPNKANKDIEEFGLCTGQRLLQEKSSVT